MAENFWGSKKIGCQGAVVALATKLLSPDFLAS
jgi:hypothetical protein